MFKAKTQRIDSLANRLPHIIKEFDGLLSGDTVLYIDYGNVRNWSDKLGWHVDLKRLKQFLDSFTPVPVAKFYYGEIAGHAESEKLISDAAAFGYEVITKPVKRIKLSIDISSISPDSPDIIRNFISPALLNTLSIEQVTQLNHHLRDLNAKGITYFEDLKCNFDVEIGRDMMVDPIMSDFTTIMLWSCDSDFADPVESMLHPDVNKSVIVCGIGGMIARELHRLRNDGLKIFDVRKLREFICWPRELPEDLRAL